LRQVGHLPEVERNVLHSECNCKMTDFMLVEVVCLNVVKGVPQVKVSIVVPSNVMP